jgi:capping protein beta
LGQSAGVWDSIHVFEVDSNGRKSATYRFTSTVILDMNSKNGKLGSLDLSGSLTRQTERVLPLEDSSSHIANIGTLVEEIESKLRNILNEVYFGKTRDIVGDLRSKSHVYIALLSRG